MYRVLMACLLLAPAASAGNAESPELRDPAGDLDLWAADVGTDLVPAVDLTAVWFADDVEGLAITIQVVDLSAVSEASPAAGTQILWSGFFQPSHATLSEVTARNGAWEARAHYLAVGEAWVFFLERPCLDGDSTDGCAGDDRDIIQVTGLVDFEANQLMILVPRDSLAGAKPGDGIYGFGATAQAHYATPAAAIQDWDLDEQEQCYQYSFGPPLDVRQKEAIVSTGGGTNGRNSAPQSLTTSDACAPLGIGTGFVPAAQDTAVDPPDVAEPEAESQGKNATTVDSPAQNAPGAHWLVALALIGFVAARRR